jgi:hypothetical protein
MKFCNTICSHVVLTVLSTTSGWLFQVQQQRSLCPRAVFVVRKEKTQGKSTQSKDEESWDLFWRCTGEKREKEDEIGRHTHKC